MKTLRDLKLRKKTEQKVRTWLEDYLKLFIKQADEQQGNVYRANFEQDDFFYFTNCNDILAKDPEAKSVETNPKIRKRKQKIILQLLMKTLLGEKDICLELKCSHCGYDKMEINATINGHFVFCPYCKYLSIVGYLDTMEDSVKNVLKRLKNGNM